MSTSDLTLDSALDRVISRYGPQIAVGSIIECFATSVRDLRAVGVSAGIAHAAESMTETRLRHRLASAVELV